MIEAEANRSSPVAILCDEFAALTGSSIGTSGEGAGYGFPVIFKNMSVFRPYGIKLITIWQDLAQAKRIFGDNGFETFLANSGVFQAFAPQDVVTAECLSQIRNLKVRPRARYFRWAKAEIQIPARLWA